MNALKKEWLGRVLASTVCRRFTPEDKRLVQLWVSDPLGELKDHIELRDGDIRRGPKDIYLILDGIYFTKAVDEDDVDLAVACFRGIHQRIMRLSDDPAMVAYCSGIISLPGIAVRKGK